MIWNAHWTMTYQDPGFLNDVESIRKASSMSIEDFTQLIESTITKITGLPRNSEKWPSLTLKRCTKCNILKTEHVHHCGACKKCIFMMDHHCCFSDRCVAFWSMKPFVLFTSYVSLLTVIGISTIWYNMTNTKFTFDQKDGGLTSFTDFIMAIFLWKPQLGFTFWTIYDMILIQSSLSSGLWASIMLISYIKNIK